MGVSTTIYHFSDANDGITFATTGEQVKKERVRKRITHATDVEKQGTIRMNVMQKRKKQLNGEQ